ncbi:FtsX-like permease family protein, partial [Streptomyces palmae]
PAGPRRPGPLRWVADLTMGARFAMTGGREGWIRTLLTAFGVGLGVTLLFVATSVPHVLSAREDRTQARDPWIASSTGLERGATTLLFRQSSTAYHGKDISGLIIRPEGADAATPPGVRKFPGPGELVVSPALKRLLDSGDGTLLRQRFAAYRVVGTIADQGLQGPSELMFYTGAKSGELVDQHNANRTKGWGPAAASLDHAPMNQTKPSPELILLATIGCVVLLLPVAVFIATAVRFGGERRDRRLAALRLVGADRAMTHRIAAGEALFGALLGLAFGTAFFLALRAFIEEFTLWNYSVFSSDLTPSAPLALLVLLAVPAAAVVVTLFALRGVTIEALGVVRQARPRRRRLWWRLALPLLGLALLYQMMTGYTAAGPRDTYQVAIGAVLVLAGTTALLPWVVEAVVARLRGGPLPWQLATRRLQLSSGAAARAVSGITVAVAGAIALQMLFSNVQAQHTSDTGQDPTRAQFVTQSTVRDGKGAKKAVARFQRTPGVREVFATVEATIRQSHDDPYDTPPVQMHIADCAMLREFLRLPHCADGDVYVSQRPEYLTKDQWAPTTPGSEVVITGQEAEDRFSARRGQGTNGSKDLVRAGKRWTVPRSTTVVHTRPDPVGMDREGIYVTPGALGMTGFGATNVQVIVSLDKSAEDAIERVRNTDAEVSGGVGNGYSVVATEETRKFRSIRNGLFIGAFATLLVIGASMIVSTLEQLRERRRLLSVLVAFGTRRSTISLSVLWQTAIPVVLGLAVSMVGGLTLGAVLLKMIEAPVAVDWAGLGIMGGIGAGVIALVTLASLPPLWRMTRPDGLRHE